MNTTQLQAIDARIAPANVVDICIAAGRSVQQLEAAVTVLASRIEASERLGEVRKLEAKIAKASELSQQRHRAMEDLEQRHKAELAAARNAYGEAYEETRHLQNQRSILEGRAMQTLRTTADPAIDQKIARLTQEHSQLLATNNRSRDMLIPEQRSSDRNVQSQYDSQRQQREEEVRQMLARNGKRLAEIPGEIAALEAAKLDPMAIVIE